MSDIEKDLHAERADFSVIVYWCIKLLLFGVEYIIVFCIAYFSVVWFIKMNVNVTDHFNFYLSYYL